MVQVSVEEFARVTQANIVYRGSGMLHFTVEKVNRPGLQLAGFFEHFKNERLQVLGQSEMTYLFSLTPECARERLQALMCRGIAGMVICRDMPVPQDMISFARKYEVALLSTAEGTSDYITQTKQYLSMLLAPRMTDHGVLVDVLGIGILLKGDSGIGKSETALELIRHGHKLVADDAVEMIRTQDGRLIGSAPETVRFLMEVRGLGLIDVRQMFGVGAVLHSKTISAVVQLEHWGKVQKMGMDRLDTRKRYTQILGSQLRCIVIPVAPGRNLASLVEIAAQNLRLESMGYNVMDELEARLSRMGSSHGGQE